MPTATSPQDQPKKETKPRKPRAKKPAAEKPAESAKPLPTNEGKPEQVEADKAAKELAAQINKEVEERKAKIKQLQEDLKAEREAVKAKADTIKAAKAAEKEAANKEREEKLKAIEDADAAIKAAQEDLEKTEEWALLAKAKEAREEVGPVPKKRRSSKPRDPNAPTGPGQYGMERDHDLKWNDKKQMLFQGLNDGGATNETSAMSTAEAAAAGGISGRDVRHYGYHAKAGGLINVAQVEGKSGYCFFLTEAGVKELETQLAAAKEDSKEEE